MTKRVTIKDIAQKAGVTIGTVHCALYGKPGVSVATRQHIINVAAEVGYKPNTAAVSLKRKTLRVAASFPGSADNSFYYYKFIWDGISDWFKTQGDLNIELVTLPFTSGTGNHAEVLNMLLKNGNIGGLLTTAETDAMGIDAIRRLSHAGTPVMLVTTDAPATGRICCVQPNYEITGRIMAELVTNQIPPCADILLCAGNMDTPSHYLVANGFCSYIEEHEKQNHILKIHPTGLDESAMCTLKTYLCTNRALGACVAVNAQGSLLLGRVLEQLLTERSIVAVGSDMFSQNTDFLQQGIFTNLINKRPYTQGYTAAKHMTEYLLSGISPPNSTVYIPGEVVFKSSLVMYSDRFTGQML